MGINKKAQRTTDSASAITATRRLFVLDIENYCGIAQLTERDVQKARQSVADRFKLNEHDFVVIGTSHTSNCASVGFAWRGARLVMTKGHDGADVALLKALDEYRLERFGEVVVMSGDGIFASKVQEMASEGVAVTIVSMRTSLSNKLKGAAPRVQFVNDRRCTRKAA